MAGTWHLTEYMGYWWNTLNATGAFGSKSNNHVDFLSNNVVRGRLTNLGEFLLGQPILPLQAIYWEQWEIARFLLQ